MIILIDNYDSFTYNLVQYLGDLGADVVVHRNDKITTSTITHIGHDMFAGIDETFDVTRYHSLVIDPQTLPESLEATAHSEDGTIMAIAHKEKNITGVQFHPESIATENGHKILNNFLKSF